MDGGVVVGYFGGAGCVGEVEDEGLFVAIAIGVGGGAVEEVARLQERFVQLCVSRY